MNGPTRCEACGANLRPRESHYVPSVGHDTHPMDAIEPYYTCRPDVPAHVARCEADRI